MRVVAVMLGLAAAAAAEDWPDDFNAACKAARDAARPVLVVVLDASPWSARLERLLGTPEVEAWIAAHVVRVGEKTAHGAGTPLLRRFAAGGLPLVVVADPEGRVAGQRVGMPDETPVQWIGVVEPWATRAAVGMGVRAYHAERYAEARRWLGPPAERGDPAALTFLGRMCAEGWGGDADREQAEALYRRAVEKDHDDAVFNLGLLLLDTKPEEAERLIREAERRGHPKACLFFAERCWGEGKETEGDAYALRALYAGRYPPAARRLAERRLAAGRDAEAVRFWAEAAPGDRESLEALLERAHAGDAAARVLCAHVDLLARQLHGFGWKFPVDHDQLIAWASAHPDEAGARAAQALLKGHHAALEALAEDGDACARVWIAFRKHRAELAKELAALAASPDWTAMLLLEVRASNGDREAVLRLAELHETGPACMRAPTRANALRASVEGKD